MKNHKKDKKQKIKKKRSQRKKQSKKLRQHKQLILILGSIKNSKLMGQLFN